MSCRSCFRNPCYCLCARYMDVSLQFLILLSYSGYFSWNRRTDCLLWMLTHLCMDMFVLRNSCSALISSYFRCSDMLMCVCVCVCVCCFSSHSGMLLCFCVTLSQFRFADIRSGMHAHDILCMLFQFRYADMFLHVIFQFKYVKSSQVLFYSIQGKTWVPHMNNKQWNKICYTRFTV